jgi:xylan 1,4-beta-xylosidase
MKTRSLSAPTPRGLAAVALVLLNSGGVAGATSYTITVDASQPTAGNPRFWTASVGTGTASLTLRPELQTHYKIANRELGMQRVRGHGVLSDDMGIYKGPGSYDWTNLDTYLNAIVSAGMRPFMELDYMPTALALTGSSHDFPNDINVYKQFIQDVVQHCVDKYGADDVGQWYWEVWNEPDYAGSWNGMNATESLAAKMTDYYALYDAAVDAATAVLPNILIGGPVATSPSPIGAFLQHCKKANKRVTFVSSHSYPGGDGNSPANATNLVTDNSARLTQIANGGYTTATVRSFDTEWNSSYSGQGGKPGDATLSMDNHWNVGFILKGVKLLSDKNQGGTPPLDVFSYWVLSDVFDESGGPSGSYILDQGGTLPFGRVFGLMTFQGVRKSSFNAFKMLNYLGPQRLMSSGGTGGDGVDAMATTSAAGDEIQILVYNFFATLDTPGNDDVTVTVTNLPPALAGKEVFVTHFRVDETHSNPYGIWVTQGSPTNPTEAQWQAMRHAQHLALLQPVSQATVTSMYTASFTMPRQAGSLLVLGLKRPLIGRNAFVEIEGEDYDGQSGAVKESSNDTTLGQSIAGDAGSYVYFENLDFGDASASVVELRVAAQSDTTLELRGDSPTGPVIGTCPVIATGGAWATQTCQLTETSGLGRLFVGFGGTFRLNWLKFQTGAGSPGAGGTADGGTGGKIVLTGTGGSAGDGVGGSTGAGGSTGVTGGGAGSGCACDMGNGGWPSGALAVAGLLAAFLGVGSRKRHTKPLLK